MQEVINYDNYFHTDIKTLFIKIHPKRKTLKKKLSTSNKTYIFFCCLIEN